MTSGRPSFSLTRALDSGGAAVDPLLSGLVALFIPLAALYRTELTLVDTTIILWRDRGGCFTCLCVCWCRLPQQTDVSESTLACYVVISEPAMHTAAPNTIRNRIYDFPSSSIESVLVFPPALSIYQLSHGI